MVSLLRYLLYVLAFASSFFLSGCVSPKITPIPPLSAESPPTGIPIPPAPVPAAAPPAPAPPVPQPVSSYYPASQGPISLNAGPAPTSEDYPVLFGTTRQPLTDGKNGYSNKRDKILHYGRVFVTIPKNHQTGSLGSEKGTNTGRDPKLKIRKYAPLRSEAEFLRMAAEKMPPVTGPNSSYVLVFIHGYNNSFDEAALRAAQFGYDLGVPKNDMFLFSWAAHQKIDEYTFDEATIDASEIYLREFLKTVERAADGRKIHLVAHSMGNRAALRVIASSISDLNIHFGQIILAAADVDIDLFRQLAPNYLKISDRTTIYISPYDYAVAASDLVHDYDRVGCGSKPHVFIPRIDSIVSTIPEDLPAHAYFAEALPVLTDIKNLLERNQPERPPGDWKFITDKNGDNGYWIVGKPVVRRKIMCPPGFFLWPH